MSEHKATPEQWANIERWASCEQWDGASCIRELRARVEELEATQHAHVDLSGMPESERQQMLESLKKPAKIQLLPLEQDHPQVVGPTPAGSLVERVADALDGGTELQARAAIREVAAWFRRRDAGAGSAWTVAADVLDAVLREEADRSTSQED
jgi:hypothetical protein